jgi:hypothetical protein
MIPRIPLRQAITDANLLGNALVGDSWRAWRTMLIAAMGEELTNEERAIFTKLTGREREPGQRVTELVAIVGRRGGKSRAMAVLMAYVAGLCDHSDLLVRGERGVALCISLDQKVAAIVRDHCAAAFEDSPILRQLIANRTQETIELTNGISIEVRPASFRKLRGPTYVSVAADEIAFWYSEDGIYRNPAPEILNAVRPGLLTTRGPLVLASSPYSKAGPLWDRFHKHYGPDGAPVILVAHGTSRDFNPTLPQSEIDRALEEDHARNTAEYLAQFRSDLEGYVSIEVVEGCVGGHREIRPAAGNTYRAFVDPAGGSGEDSFSAAIGHKSLPDDQIIVDAVREFRPRFSPAAVI